MKRVYLVTYGRMSQSVMLSEDEVQKFLKTIPIEERRCALITATDLDASDLDFISRTQEIIKRLETEITETKLNLEHRLKTRSKRGA